MSTLTDHFAGGGGTTTGATDTALAYLQEKGVL